MRQPSFEKLGNSLGALGFLIDMLSYQRTMARKLFVYDEELGELRILVGKARARATDDVAEAPEKLEERVAPPLPDVVPRFPAQEVPASAPAVTATPADASPAAASAELASDIFFDLQTPQEPLPVASDLPPVVVPSAARLLPDENIEC